MAGCDVSDLGTVAAVREMSQAELWDACGVADESQAWAAWDTVPLVIEFSSGAILYPMADADGNEAGTYALTRGELSDLVGHSIAGVFGRDERVKLKFSDAEGTIIKPVGVFVLVMPNAQAYYL